jgi:Protein of unknown function DUF262
MDITKDFEQETVIDISTRDNNQLAQQTISDTNHKYRYDPTKTIFEEAPLEQFSIYEYIRLYKKGRLIIDPDFQRNIIWQPEQKSRFIESIILNFPLPALYVNQKKDNSYEIVDGLQRTSALIEFLDKENGFRLMGLKVLSYLNGSKFKDLPSIYQAKIEAKKLWIYIIKPSVPISIVYDIFDRINTDSTPLNRQEVRNSILKGESTKLLKKLSEQDYFKKAINNGVDTKRMKDREMILRYLSFSIFDYQADYQGDMNEFIENAMRKINLMSVKEIDVLEKNFKRIMEITFDFFGNKNFRIPVYATDIADKIEYKINIALFESVSHFFSLHSNEWLLSNKNKIKENFIDLVEVYLDMDTRKTKSDDLDELYVDEKYPLTNSRYQVITRFNTAKKILGRVDDVPF